MGLSVSPPGDAAVSRDLVTSGFSVRCQHGEFGNALTKVCCKYHAGMLASTDSRSNQFNAMEIHLAVSYGRVRFGRHSPKGPILQPPGSNQSLSINQELKVLRQYSESTNKNTKASGQILFYISNVVTRFGTCHRHMSLARVISQLIGNTFSAGKCMPPDYSIVCQSVLVCVSQCIHICMRVSECVKCVHVYGLLHMCF